MSTSRPSIPMRCASARVGDNLGRLGLAAQLVTADAGATDWWDGRQYDRILADVPCTASGIVRRHPDIRWLRRKWTHPNLQHFQPKYSTTFGRCCCRMVNCYS